MAVKSASKKPSTNGANGRNTKGQFAKGNRCGTGSPHCHRLAELRKAFINAVNIKDVKAVTNALMKEAKRGNVPAIKELFDRLFGKPVELDLLERIDFLEEQLHLEAEKRSSHDVARQASPA